MGPQYQATVDSYAASPQATQSSGNQTLGKAMEQSPVHDGFGTRSSMYDNGMDVSPQPAPTTTPPQPQNRPAMAGSSPSWAPQTLSAPDQVGVNPSWAQQPQNQLSNDNLTTSTDQQQQRKRGGRAKRADGGMLGAALPSPMMMTGDTLARLAQQNAGQANAAPPAVPPSFPTYDYAQTMIPQATLYNRGLSNQDLVNQVFQQALGRAPLEAGRQFWTNELANRGRTQQQVEQDILNSPEMRNRSFINQAYQSALGRAPAQTDLSNYMTGLKAGTINPQQIQQQIMNSPEVQANLARGITPDQFNQVDPFVAGYNARVQNAQDQIGNIVRQNFATQTSDKQAYQTKLAEVQKANEARLAAARQAKAKREEQEAAQAQALAMMMMMMR